MKRASWIRRMFEEAERIKRERGSDAVADLSLGNPVEEPPPEFLDSLKAAVSVHTEGTHRYMNNAGYTETRRAVAEMLSAEHGVPVHESQILMTCGAAGALNVVLKALLDPGDEVVIFAPYFAEYMFYVDNHQGAVRVAETGPEFQPNADHLAQVITDRTKAVLINTPNNPTGVVYSPQQMNELVTVLKDRAISLGREIYLISDEVYRHLVYEDAAQPSVLALYPHSIIVSSFSKDLGLAGERIGFVAMSPGIANIDVLFSACVTANRVLGFVNAPALMQRAVVKCLDARVSLELYRRNRDVLCEALVTGGFRVVRPGGAFYIFPQCPEADDVACCAALRDRGVIVVPGSGFGRPGYLRIAYSVDAATAERAAEVFASFAG